MSYATEPEALVIALDYTPKLSSLWVNGNLNEKKKIQKMIFPEGIEYDCKTEQYRTLRVNSFFSYIPVIPKDVDNKKPENFV